MNHEQAMATQLQLEFERVRGGARRADLMALVTRRSNRLLSYREARGEQRGGGERYGGARTVNVREIVGSAERSGDFDRNSRPRGADAARRWKSVARAAFEGKTLPPVDLIQVGGGYFVVDGHHRISVARALGIDFIDAEVVEVGSPPVGNVVARERPAFAAATGRLRSLTSPWRGIRWSGLAPLSASAAQPGSGGGEGAGCVSACSVIATN